MGWTEELVRLGRPGPSQCYAAGNAGTQLNIGGILEN
jgi:hypothetical protein